MDLMKKFFVAKGANVEKFFCSVLDGTNTMSGRKNGLQRCIRNESPHKLRLFLCCAA